MRISDWSSDVCSSDLQIAKPLPLLADQILFRNPQPVEKHRVGVDGLSPHLLDLAHLRRAAPVEVRIEERQPFRRLHAFLFRRGPREQQNLVRALRRRGPHLAAMHHIRSEEHTSELKSLMSISYAVFCLKKKKQK